MAATETAKSERKERLDAILECLRSGDELATYDMVVKFRVHPSTVYRDMSELERYHGVERRREATGKTGSGEVVWYIPGAE